MPTSTSQPGTMATTGTFTRRDLIRMATKRLTTSEATMQSGQSAGSGESMAANSPRFEQLAMPAVNDAA